MQMLELLQAPVADARILIVDDQPANVEALGDFLQAEGCQIIPAYNGNEALQRVADEAPDLVLLDVMMPGMSGFEVCRQLKTAPETVFLPVVLVTGLSAVEDRVMGAEAGADDFLTKPVDGQELVTRVRSLLRIKRLHDALENRNRLLHQVLGQYLADQIVEEVLADPERLLRLGGASREVTVLFADIRGFTLFAEEHEPQRVVETLNLIFERLSRVVVEWGGTLDKYLGDALMAFYGAPIAYGEDALATVGAALEMRQAFGELKSGRDGEALRRLGLGIGLHSGTAVVGNVGSRLLMDFTIIGDVVNVAKRLQEEAGPGQILISDATLDLVRGRLRTEMLPPRVLTGRKEPIICHRVRGFA